MYDSSPSTTAVGCCHMTAVWIAPGPQQCCLSPESFRLQNLSPTRTTFLNSTTKICVERWCVDRRLGWKIERIVLLFIILLGLADFFGILPPFWGYIQDIPAWVAICYVIYAVSLTDLFFGNRHEGVDLTIIAAYVMMSLKELIATALFTQAQLTALASSYVSFSVSDATTGVPFQVSTAELNSYNLLHIVPRGAELAGKLVGYFTVQQQQISVLLVDGVSQAAITATPTGLDGMMLMFYNTLLAHSAAIQTAGILIGTALLIIAACYGAYRIAIRRPSILSILGEEGPAKPFRALWLFVLFLAFYVMAFNLLFEWLTIAMDAPLLLVTIIVIIFLFAFRHEWRRSDEALEAVESESDGFYERSLSMLKDRKTVLLVISGLLVLHLISDIASFLVPSFIGMYRSVYAAQLGDMPTFYAMVSSSLSGTLSHDVLIIVAYVLSVIGLFSLLALPGVIWYKIYRLRSTNSHEHIPDWKGWHIGLLMACITAYLFLPVYSIGGLRGGEVVGVNIVASAITPDQATVIPMVLMIAAGVFALCVIIGFLHDWARRLLMLAPLGAAMGFFGVYVYQYFTSAFMYYARSLVTLAQSGDITGYLIVPTLFVMFGLTIIFFITGFGSFLYEMWRD